MDVIVGLHASGALLVLVAGLAKVVRPDSTRGLLTALGLPDRRELALSIGVIGSASGGTIEEILHRAAGALNHAKRQGGNRVVVAHPAKDSGGKPAAS